MSKVTVGKSWRTPYKHDLLRRVLGREVAAKPPHGRDIRHWVDLTAGDGVVADGDDWLMSCSPGLFAKYAMHGADDHGHTVSVLLVEKSHHTFELLLRSLESQLPPLGWHLVGTSNDGARWAYDGKSCRSYLEARYGDGRDVDLDSPTGTPVFAYNDPNHMNHFAMPEQFLARLRDRGCLVSSMSTMGCNVGGLKMLGIEERELWYRQLGEIRRGMPRNHNLVLAQLMRDPDGRKDAHQWGYAISGPATWTRRTVELMEKAFAGCEMDIASTDDDRQVVMDRLFLTKEERGVA